MRKLCQTADTLWLDCVKLINEHGEGDEYFAAQTAYTEHKRTCTECKKHLKEYLDNLDERDSLARSAHCGKRY